MPCKLGISDMWVYIGDDVVVSLQDMVLILDAKEVDETDVSREVIQYAESEHRLIRLGGPTKSYVVTKDKVYASPTSSLTLSRRAKPGEVV